MDTLCVVVVVVLPDAFFLDLLCLWDPPLAWPLSSSWIGRRSRPPLRRLPSTKQSPSNSQPIMTSETRDEDGRIRRRLLATILCFALCSAYVIRPGFSPTSSTYIYVHIHTLWWSVTPLTGMWADRRGHSVSALNVHLWLSTTVNCPTPDPLPLSSSFIFLFIQSISYSC